MKLFEDLIYFYKNGQVGRGIGITIGLIIIFALMLWVSIIDIKKKSITVWKMLLASFSTILVPLVMSFFCGCPYLKFFLMGSVLLWFFLLYLNIKYNNDKIVGKADMDVLTAIIAECTGVSAWIFFMTKIKGAQEFPQLQVIQLWYIALLYLLIGALLFIAIVIIIQLIRSLFFKKGNIIVLLLGLKGQTLSVIPMLIPIAVMVPYNIMIM